VLPDNIKEAIVQPIRSRRLSGFAVDQITALIEEGKLAVGQKLPSERELTNQLNVSRASTREALRVLEAQGLIEVRPGKGAYVVASIPQGDIQAGLNAWFEEHRDEVLDMLEVRELLEGYAVYQAAQVTSPEVVREMRETIEEMRRCVEMDALVEATSADRKFHRLLYEASGNRFLKLLGDGIVGALFGPRFSLLRIPGWAQRSLEEHTTILDAIETGNPEGAKEAIHKHMAGIRSALESGININW